MSGSRLLTKSLFKTAVTCPRKLAYATRPDLYPRRDASNPLRQNLGEEGRRFEMYCRLKFPNGVDVSGGRPVLDSKSMTTSNEQEYRTVEELIEETRLLISQPDDRVTIFEGAVRYDNFYVQADIIDRIGNELRLIEVKMKSLDSSKADNIMVGKRGGIKSSFLPYIQDVAFQKMVLQNAFPNLNVTAFLLMPDKAVKTNLPNLNALVATIQSKEYGDSPSYLGIGAEEARALITESDEKLTALVDVSDLADIVLKNELDFPGSSGQMFTEACTQWADEISKDNDELESNAPISIGSHCKTCEYRLQKDCTSTNGRSGFNICWKEATKLDDKVLRDQSSLVLDLWHGTKKDLNRLIGEGKFLLSDVLPADLGLAENSQELKKKSKKENKSNGMSRSLRQFYQIVGLHSADCSKQDLLLDSDYLLDEMSRWRYPFNFVDFETAAPALPYSSGKAPFDMIAFQFSHHTLQKNGRLEHASQFLHTLPGECPNEAFRDALGAALGDNEGTVFRWGTHENTVLSALLEGELSEELSPLLSGGKRAMIDLMSVATKGYYIVGSCASSSIKRLLLPTLRASVRLEQVYGKPTYSSHNFTDMQWFQRDENGQIVDPYDLLLALDADSNLVSDGGSATVAYKILQCENLEPDARASLEAALLRYCELDTLAMALIVQAWQDFLGVASTTDD